ncbi:MAG: DUF3971 domain-containing protein, partial [Pseudomonadota bacterium]
MRTLFWFAVAFGLMLAAGLATLKYLVLPRISEYQTDILARVSEVSGMNVTAKMLRGGWSGFTPFVEMEEVDFRDRASVKSPVGGVPAVEGTGIAGATALSLPLVRAAVSIPYLFIGQTRLAELYVFEPKLSLHRASNGIIYFAGRPLNTREPDDGRFLDWLIAQPGIQLHRATVSWRDDLKLGAELQFTDVGIQIEKHFGRHDIGITATPPAQLAKKMALSGRVLLTRSDDAPGRLQVEGTLFANVLSANLTELRRHLNVPDNWQSGVGTVRAWVELDSTTPNKVVFVANTPRAQDQFVNPVKSVTADVHIINAKAQLGDEVAPLNIAKLEGRLEYLRHDNGFTVGSKKLEFRTKEGVSSPPADFSFSQRNKVTEITRENANATGTTENESGEITANGIDLKVMTSLIEYFPIGKEARQLAAKFGLRGEVKASRFAWTGKLDKPASYQIRGTLVNFGLLASDKIPGVSGFSGNIDGSDKGGVFSIASKALTLDVPAQFRAPLRFETVESQGKWTSTGNDIVVDIAKLALANNDIAIELGGKYSRPRPKAGAELAPEVKPGALDIAGRLTRATAIKVANYLPNGLGKARDYIEWATRDGLVDGADFVLKGRIFDFPFHQGVGGQFSVKAKLKDIDFQYTEGWPQANKINAELIIENTSIRANIDSAQIFGAHIRNTKLGVADTDLRPGILTITGEAEARGEDVSRYFRESPMINNIGAFTKVVDINGPGKLNLDISIPLGQSAEAAKDPKAPKFRINGKYSMSRGFAKPTVGPLITNLGGSIVFSETGVKSSGVAGMAYGNPIAIHIAGGGEAGVVTNFAGRADVQLLGDVLPFKLPQQITGVTDFTGRIAPKRDGMEIVIDSSMLGVISTLPSPLTKRGDEARRLKVSFMALGQPAEKIRVSVLGNIVAGSVADAPETRIDARFQRKFDGAGISNFYGGVASVGEQASDANIPEGIWLTGTLKHLDFDQWKKAVENFYPIASVAVGTANAAGAISKSGAAIVGFDFRLGRLMAYGRPFDDLNIKGRRTGETWAMSAISKEAEGDITWRSAAFSERGAVRARLKKLVLSDDAPAAQPSTAMTELGQKEGDLPALDVVADEFTLKGRWLGKLELKATPQVSNWKIDQLTISNGHLKAEMNGIWQRYGDPFAAPSAGAVKSLTTMNIKLESSNLNALFSQFGFGDQMKGGRGGLDGTLSWPGHT